MAFSAKFRGVVIDMFGTEPDELTRDTALVEDLGADSLDMVEFAMMLEEAFDVEIPEDVVEAWPFDGPAGVTLGAIADELARLGAKL